MAVKVSVYGSDKESDEYIGALKLKKNNPGWDASLRNGGDSSFC